MRDLKVAIIQTNQFWEDKVANFNHFEKEHFSKIKAGECDLILLPEMFNTGFSLNTNVLAEPMNLTTQKWMKQMLTGGLRPPLWLKNCYR